MLSTLSSFHLGEVMIKHKGFLDAITRLTEWSSAAVSRYRQVRLAIVRVGAILVQWALTSY